MFKTKLNFPKVIAFLFFPMYSLWAQVTPLKMNDIYINYSSGNYKNAAEVIAELKKINPKEDPSNYALFIDYVVNTYHDYSLNNLQDKIEIFQYVRKIGYNPNGRGYHTPHLFTAVRGWDNFFGQDIDGDYTADSYLTEDAKKLKRIFIDQLIEDGAVVNSTNPSDFLFSALTQCNPESVKFLLDKKVGPVGPLDFYLNSPIQNVISNCYNSGAHPYSWDELNKNAAKIVKLFAEAFNKLNVSNFGNLNKEGSFLLANLSAYHFADAIKIILDNNHENLDLKTTKYGCNALNFTTSRLEFLASNDKNYVFSVLKRLKKVQDLFTTYGLKPEKCFYPFYTAEELKAQYLQRH
ncbi:MAG: hypothetical protein QE271_08820 [Bacteriovoracaceae bacterium]|nr:hypothetical protein [Bacteriovoracaceae bacterium]